MELGVNEIIRTYLFENHIMTFLKPCYVLFRRYQSLVYKPQLLDGAVSMPQDGTQSKEGA
jgi:hypothetical protein|uniref:Uncharacterized protein n=1 Tax=Arabidopsis thaliana TaxID=3702 RepID=Q1G303_ARATH|nr:unknown protein [Arabidopsis thaliana]